MPQRCRKKKIVWFLCILYLLFMFWMLFGRSHPDIGKSYWDEIRLNINIVPFHTIKGYLHILLHKTNPYLLPNAFMNLAGNIAAFIPLGFFVPCLLEREKSFGRFFLHHVLGLGGMELVQLLTLRGRFDVDDILLNVLGATIGFFLLRLLCAKKKAA